MEILTAIVAGGLFATGVYLLLRRSLVKIILGLAILSNAVNLVIFTGAGLVRHRPPFVPDGAAAPGTPYADPLPQAFMLTAIVISFGILAFTVALILRIHRVTGVDDIDSLRETDR